MNGGNEIPSLAGESVALRPIAAIEAAIVHQWIQEYDILTQTCRPPVFRTAEEVAEGMKGRQASPEKAALAIVLRGTGTLVGQVRYFDLNFRNRSVEIGYVVAPSARGKALGREAVGLLLDYLFGGLGMNKVYAQTASFNGPSIKLLESLGFARDAVLREHHLYQGKLHDDFVYSVLARDWQARPRR